MQTIDTENPAFQAEFQEHILEHWQQIQQDKRFPSKRDFRPQNFPKYLPQLAIVAVDENETYADRLTGTAVSEILKLADGEEQLVAPSNENVRKVIKNILDQAKNSDHPVYFEGKFTLESNRPIGFSVLVLPFSLDEPHEKIDSLLLAFNFSKAVMHGALS